MKSFSTLGQIKILLLVIFEVLKRQRVYFIFSIIVLLCLLFAQLKFNFFSSRNSINIGLIGTFQEYDLPLDVTKLISDSLVIADETGRMKPNLASGWETNNNATDFKFKLKHDLKFADGSKVLSSDLEFSIPDVETFFPDNQTIQFKLKDTYSPFPSLLTKPIFKKGTLMGVGSYLVSRIEKSRIFITKITLTPMTSDMPVIYVRFYPNEKVAQTGFALGEIEALFGVSDVKSFANNPNVLIDKKIDYTKIVTVLYSMTDPLIGGKSRSLRQALSFIAPQIKGEEIANNPYPPKSWVYNNDHKKYLNNAGEAKQALDRAKTQIGKDKLNSDLILTATPNLEEVGNQVVSSWKNLGLNAKLRIESGIPQNFQALLITQSIPADPDQYSLWHATQTKTNIAKVDVKRIDKDLEDGRKIIAENERKEKYFDFQKALLEEAPAIFLYFPKYNIVYLKKSEKLLNKILSLNRQK